MNAMEKAHWLEFLVSVAAVVVTAALIPWLGAGAWGGFGLLGLVACAALFLRKRGETVVVDERDRTIDQRAIRYGIFAAWQVLLLTLIAMVLWSSHSKQPIPTDWLTWLICIDAAVSYGAKGLAGVIMHRRLSRAA